VVRLVVTGGNLTPKTEKVTSLSHGQGTLTMNEQVLSTTANHFDGSVKKHVFAKCKDVL